MSYLEFTASGVVWRELSGTSATVIMIVERGTNRPGMAGSMQASNAALPTAMVDRPFYGLSLHACPNAREPRPIGIGHEYKACQDLAKSHSLQTLPVNFHTRRCCYPASSRPAPDTLHKSLERCIPLLFLYFGFPDNTTLLFLGQSGPF